MPSDAPDIDARKPPVGGRKLRLLTLDHLDARTTACRHALSLRDAFLSDLGGADLASTAQREIAQRAAILGALLEHEEAKLLRGDGVELGEYATLVNAQRRVLSDIGLERRARDITRNVIEQAKAEAARKDKDT